MAGKKSKKIKKLPKPPICIWCQNEEYMKDIFTPVYLCEQCEKEFKDV